MTPSTPGPHHPERSPRHVAFSLFDALNGADVARAASLFSVDGCFVTPDGTAVTGARNLRAIFRQIGGLAARLDIESLGFHQAGDVCLVDGRLRYRTGGEGAPGNGGEGVSGEVLHPRMVLRRGRPAWELVIVALWGR